MKKPKSTKSNLKWYVSVGIVGILIFSFLFASFSPYSPYYMWWKKGGAPAPPGEDSSFSLFDYATGEDVSNVTKGSVWTPLNVSAVPNWEESDYLDISLYNETIASELTEDIEIDLTDIPVFFFEVSTFGGYANNFFLCGGGGNFEFVFPAFTHTADINFNIVDSVFNEITVVNHQTNGTYLLVYNVDDYETECEAPLYDPALDTLLDWDDEDPLTMFTNVFGFQFDFNATIGTGLTGVNFVIDEDLSAVVIKNLDDVYVLFYNILSFDELPTGFFYTIGYGKNIKLSDVDAVRVVVPEGEGGTFTATKISDIAV